MGAKGEAMARLDSALKRLAAAAEKSAAERAKAAAAEHAVRRRVEDAKGHLDGAVAELRRLLEP
jgi:signal transduction histidine kinase